MGVIQTISKNARLIASSRNWIEGDAVEQLKSTSSLDGIIEGIGMPDIHPGKGHPVGAVFISETVIYPYIIGNDIGCGVGLWQTSIKKNKIKRDKWVKKLAGFNHQLIEDINPWLEKYGVDSSLWNESIGTIGKGNHFAELSVVSSIKEERELSNLGLDKNRAVILVHSGSRGLGDHVLRAYVDKHKAGGVAPDSSDGRIYLEDHNTAVAYAGLNREIITRKICSLLNADYCLAADCVHNFISTCTTNNRTLYVHRKGAVSALNGPVVIAGTRGSCSYIVKPVVENTADVGDSLPHGAGRKWKRGEARGKLKSRFSSRDLTHTKLGSMVICDDKKLLYQEAPEAYKNIEIVISDMVDAGLIKVIALLSPVITYKVNSQ